jgi:hypothetical protein
VAPESVNYDSRVSQPEESKKKEFKGEPGREKMIEQNIKLKTQIYELAKQMDEIVQR